MEERVKITHGECGPFDEPAEMNEEGFWCAVISDHLEGETTVCSQSLTGGAKFEKKSVKRGGITCPFCLEKIKEIKSIRL